MVEISCDDREFLVRSTLHEVALDCILDGIAAAHPATRVEETVSVADGELTVTSIDGRTSTYDLDAYDEIVLVGGGNAAGTLATALEEEFGDELDGGVVVTDNPTETTTTDVLSGDHPVPSERGMRNTQRLLERAEAVGEDDLVLVPITGGGSALLAAPAEHLSLEDLQLVTEELLASGATIAEINAVRKHCSAIKGGQLARAAAPATVVTLLISDVVGDDLSVVASGPTVPDSSTYADALEVIERYALEVPDSVISHLRAGQAGDHPETPEADAQWFENVTTHVIGNGRTALNAAAETATARGYDPVLLAAGVEGEAQESALTHVAIAEECRESGSSVAPPAVLLSGGETTVTLGKEHGEGGPNQEFALSSALALDADGIVVASVDTDGIDGATDAAGAIVDTTAVPEFEGRAALERNDAFPILADAGAIIRTGPTGTNVNDLRAIVVTER